MNNFIKQLENMRATRMDEHIRQYTFATRNIREILNKPEWEPWAHMIQELSLYGWYVAGDLKITEFNEISALLEEGNIAKLNQRMTQLIEGYLDGIIEAILRRHSSRRGPLKEAFWAHKQELYFLSIPVFFAQIDGLCDEGTGRKFF
ncbi:hypothetical protein [Chitinophaga polysaccharea]|uniref:hypothetical protein n=1 Tax=Chitinophaga polysaccharea TaxID=1293035 RepID=UPI001158A34D|nr:hypothetical protein [Chitinophaga polysaccharea]